MNLIATPTELSIAFEISAVKTGTFKNLIMRPFCARLLSRDITSKMIFGISYHWHNLIHQNNKLSKQFIGTFAKNCENVKEEAFLSKITLCLYYLSMISPATLKSASNNRIHIRTNILGQKNNHCKSTWIINIRFKKCHRGEKSFFF